MGFFFYFVSFFFSTEKSMIPLVPLVPEVWFHPNLGYIFAMLQNLMVPLQKISVPCAWNLNCAVWSCNTRNDVFFVCLFFLTTRRNYKTWNIISLSISLILYSIPFWSICFAAQSLLDLLIAVQYGHLFIHLTSCRALWGDFFSSYRGSHCTTFNLVSKVITVEFIFNSYSLLLVRNFKLHSQGIIFRSIRLRTVMNIPFSSHWHFEVFSV